MSETDRAGIPAWKRWLINLSVPAVIIAAIYISPRAVAIVVGSLAIVLVAVVWWIKVKIRKFIEPFKNLEFYPGTVDLIPATDIQWHKPEEVEAMSTAFRKLGFAHTGDYRAEKDAGINFRGFVHIEQRIYALIYDLEYMSDRFDLVTAYEDGSYMTYSNTDLPEILERPPTMPIERMPGASVKAVYEQCIAKRPAGAMKAVSADALASSLKQYVDEENRWRVEHADWEEKLRLQIEETFLATVGWSAIEWNRKEDRVVFVHDSLRKMDAFERFVNSVYVDDDDLEARISSQAHDLVAELSIRRAFAKMIELAPAGQEFEKIATFNVELDVDAYLAPERPAGWGEDDD
jgi:hypothetical protein